MQRRDIALCLTAGLAVYTSLQVKTLIEALHEMQQVVGQHFVDIEFSDIVERYEED